MRTKTLLIPIVSLIIVLIIVVIYVNLASPGFETNIYPQEIRKLISNKPISLIVRVDEFENNTLIPAKYTCDGLDISPKIIVDNIPENTVTLVIIVFDPDAPYGTFYHWILYDVRVNETRIIIPEDVKSSTKIGFQTMNDFKKIGYGGPCPPHGDKEHHYIFLVLALDTEIGREYNDYNELFNVIGDHVIAYGVYIGVYKR